MDDSAANLSEVWPTELLRMGRTILIGLFCGYLLFEWAVGNAGQLIRNPDRFSGQWISIATLPGPLTLTVWSLFTGSNRRPQTLHWARQIIKCHGLVGAVLFLTGGILFFAGIWQPYAIGGAIGGLVAATIDLILLGLTPRAVSAPSELRTFHRGMFGISGGALVGTIIWPFAIVGLVALEAEHIADGRPYCIEVPRDFYGNYRQVSSISELNGWTMFSPCCAGGSTSYQFGFHAVLNVQIDDIDDGKNGPRLALWNWSYYRFGFTPIPDHTVAVTTLRSHYDCPLQTHMVLKLPMITS